MIGDGFTPDRIFLLLLCAGGMVWLMGWPALVIISVLLIFALTDPRGRFLGRWLEKRYRDRR